MPEDIIKPNQPSTEPENNEPPEPETTNEEFTVESSETETTNLDIDTTASDTPDTPTSLDVNTPTPTPTPVPPIPPTVPETPQFNAEPKEPKKRGPKLWVIAILVILIVAASAAFAFIISKSDDTEKATTNAAAKKDIQNFRYALPDGDLSKFYPSGNSATSVQLNSQVFEGLVRYEDQTKIVPLLAKSWSNPDTSTWVFKLRDDVTFHNGNPLTAADVKYSLDYATQHADDENTILFVASSITGTEVINDHEIKVTTDGPDPILLNKLAYLYIIDDEAQMGSADGGTGPYVVKDGTTPSENSIELIAWDKYYGGHIYTRSISMSILPSAEEMIKAANDGQYDFVGSLEEDEITKIKNYEKIEGQNFSIGFIGLNTTRPGSPLASKEGRQAITYALDIPKVLEAGKLTGTPSGQLVPPKIPGHDPSIKVTPPNPAKAKELLAEVPNADAPLKLSFGGGEDNFGHMTEIANQLKSAGLNVTLDEQPDLDSLINVAFGGETDMFYIVYDSPTLDGYDFFSSLLQGNTLYDNPEINEQINESMTTVDPAKRLKLLKEISKAVADDVPVIPIYVPTDLFALRKPYFIKPDIPGAQAGIYFWQSYQN